MRYEVAGGAGSADLVLWQGHGAIVEESDDVRLPFRTGVALQEGEKAAITATGDGPPRTCRIVVDGETAVERTAPERVTCEFVVEPAPPGQAPERDAPG